MKIALASYSDNFGGAARAAYRIYQALCRQGVDCSMHVEYSISGDPTVNGLESKWQATVGRLRQEMGVLLTRTLKTSNGIIHSPAIVPSRWRSRLNATDADVINLHWVNWEMLSIADIARLRKPVVWTLHGMWAFCGAEQCTEEYRWRDGYLKSNRPDYESGFDLNRWTWERKRRHWQRPMQIVTPSRWLAQCVRESALLKSWPVAVIPNALDTEFWMPVNRVLARQLLGLPDDVPMVVFGTAGANAAHHKGFDLLHAALQHLRGEVRDLRLLVFGQQAPRNPPDFGFPVHYMGLLQDELTLRVLYSAADALVIPSRIENLPNTGIEAMACGTPVVAFDTCGLPDIVDHMRTGYLARAFDTNDLAQGIRWVLDAQDPMESRQGESGDSDSMMLTWLGRNARQRAVERFSYPVVANQYSEVFSHALQVLGPGVS